MCFRANFVLEPEHHVKVLPVVQVPLFFIPERALFLHVIKGTITVGNDQFSVFWPKWIYENLGRAFVCLLHSVVASSFVPHHPSKRP